MLLAILASQSIGFGATALIVGLTGDSPPSAEAIIWASAAGLCVIVGLGAFYLALSRGTMGLVAPLAALIGAGVPAVVAMLAGETVGPLRLTGIVVALVAVVLISLPTRQKDAAERRALRLDGQDVPLVLLSGLGFAGFFLFLDRAQATGGGIWWSLLAVRLVGLLVVLTVLALALLRASDMPLRRRASDVLGVARMRTLSVSLVALVPLLAVAGAGDLGGNSFFVLANEHDSLAVAVVLSSLYPVVTTLLAALLLRERLRPMQLAGIGLAVAGVALIGGGEAIPVPETA